MAKPSKEAQLLSQYAQIKCDIKELEEEAKSIQPEVLKIVADQQFKAGEDIPVEDPGGRGKFILEPRKKFIYSQKVLDLEAKLKEMKDEEEAKGYATFTETKILKFLTPRAAKQDAEI